MRHVSAPATVPAPVYAAATTPTATAPAAPAAVVRLILIAPRRGRAVAGVLPLARVLAARRPAPTVVAPVAALVAASLILAGPHGVIAPRGLVASLAALRGIVAPVEKAATAHRRLVRATHSLAFCGEPHLRRLLLRWGRISRRHAARVSSRIRLRRHARTTRERSVGVSGVGLRARTRTLPLVPPAPLGGALQRSGAWRRLWRERRALRNERGACRGQEWLLVRLLRLEGLLRRRWKWGRRCRCGSSSCLLILAHDGKRALECGHVACCKVIEPELGLLRGSRGSDGGHWLC